MAAAIVLALTAGAAEPAHGDSIDAATQQLQALKADANAAKAGTDAGRLPAIAIPQLHEPESDAAVVLPDSTLQKKDKKRSANWLVDGVMKQDPAYARHSRDQLGNRPARSDDRSSGRLRANASDATDPSDQTNHNDPTDPTDPRAPRASADGDTNPDRAEPKHAGGADDPVFNPLTRYMADWLAPQDASVLRQTLNAPAGTDTDSVAGSQPVTVPAGDTALASALSAFTADNGRLPKHTYDTTKRSDNPYLDAMALPDLTPPPSNPPAIDPSPAPPPAPIQPAAAAPESTRPVIPDFVKPLDDDKYYKPLKRF